MSVDKVLERGRRVRLQLMRAECEITRPADTRAWNPDSGKYESSMQVIYRGPCHFKSWSSIGQRIGNVSEREVVLTSYDVVLPWHGGTEHVSTSDTVTITECPDDPWVIEIPLAVTSYEYAHDRTARHLTCSDQNRGEVDYA